MLKIKKCCFCNKEIDIIGQNNPSPVNNEEGAVCCNRCNFNIVIPARMKQGDRKYYERMNRG